MTMARYQFTVVDGAGDVVPNANVSVKREQPGAPLAALKSDRDGATGISNPNTTDSNGYFGFHVAGGAYQIRAWLGPSGAPTFERIWRYVGVGLGSETDSVAGGAPFAIVRVVSTANVTIASALEAGDTLDSVTLVAGDFVLLTAQTAPAENGVYEVPASGAASRAAAFSTYDSMPGCYFSVMEGTAGADKLYRCTSNRGGTLETDAIIISEFTSGGGSSGRAVLSANRTYYVAPSGSGGSDSNDGLTALTPFLTKQKAYNVIAMLDLGGFTATIQIADGTYTSGLSITVSPVGGNVSIVGNISTPGNVVISTTSASAISVSSPINLSLSGLKLQTTTSGDSLLVAGAGSNVTLGSGMQFGASAGAQININRNGLVAVTAAYTINGSAPYHIRSQQGGLLSGSSIAVTLTGTPAFNPTISVESTGVATMFSWSFTGSATGVRYAVSGNGVLNSFGSGTASTFFPGSSNGTTASGGQQL